MRCKPTPVPPRAHVIHDMFECATAVGKHHVESGHTRWLMEGKGTLTLSNRYPRCLVARFEDYGTLTMQSRHDLGEYSQFTLDLDTSGLGEDALLNTQFDGEDMCHSIVIRKGFEKIVGTCPMSDAWPRNPINEFVIEVEDAGCLIVRGVTILDVGPLPRRPEKKRAPPGALFLVTSSCTAR
ncbi:hypothetical protein [Luteibacter sp. CQ10]|uniref:hypothetical protein n=1 Tax=Luteibacter sp. CQ10 TaxID=2805821 RepID=UPI0034A4FD7F